MSEAPVNITRDDFADQDVAVDVTVDADNQDQNNEPSPEEVESIKKVRKYANIVTLACVRELKSLKEAPPAIFKICGMSSDLLKGGDKVTKDWRSV